MIGLLRFVVAVLASPFKSKIRLEAENATLRYQLVVLRRKLKGRAHLTNDDRWFFVQLYRWFPSILPVLMIIRPETLVRWHRAGFRRYWRWKSRRRGGRPQIDTELRALIRRMSVENPLWGAPRIHGELLKLGFEVGQSSVAKYMVKRRAPPSQGWRTFLHNHAPDVAAMDLFVVPTIGFDLLYAFVIVRLDRRDLIWINVTANPTAERVARQIKEAFRWDMAPRCMISHSMGGLVSQYFLEVMGGWKETRALVTFGTPYRGSLNALGYLANGFSEAVDPLKLDLTSTLATFTVVYQLLPAFECVDRGHGKLERIGEIAGANGVDPRL